MSETSAVQVSSAPARQRPLRRRLTTATAALVAIAGGGAVAAVLSGPAAGARSADTVAGSASSLTAGRGAAVPFVEQEAVNAKTNGTKLQESRAWDTLAGEAVGRRAVTLAGRGQYVEFTLSQPANSIDVRYSIPDSPTGAPYTASLSLYVDGVKQKDLTLTNKYSWYYGVYPFVNTPGSGNPHHFYDEVHELLGKKLPAGSKVRLQVDAEDTAGSYTIDLADFEDVAAPVAQPAGSVSVTDFGADPTGTKESSGAFTAAIASALGQGKAVWIPPGRFTIDKHLVLNSNVTLEGAGPWYSVLTGNGIGLYGNAAPKPSLGVHLSDFAIEGSVDARDDAAQLNGIGGAMGGGSTISNVWIEHTKVGIWLDGPFDGLTISNCRIDDTTADGINLHDGITHAAITNDFIRNTGDDGIAAWSEQNPDTDNVISFDTVEVPILANNIAIYGGADNAVTDDVVSDTQTQGGGIHVANRFKAVPLAGTTTIARDTALRTGVLDPNWKYGVGALWFWADDSPMDGAVRVRDVDLIDSSYEGLQFAGASVSNVTFTNVRIAGAGTFALQLESHGDASFENVVATDIGAPSGIYDCLFTGGTTSAFTIHDAGGNSGWQTKPYCGKWPKPVYRYGYPKANPPADFALSLPDAVAAYAAGAEFSVPMSTALRSGDTQRITVAATTNAPGATVRLTSSAFVAGGHTTMTVKTSTSTPPGRYSVEVAAKGSSRTHSATYTFMVSGSQDVLHADTWKLDFVSQSVGEPSAAHTIRLSNTGTAPIHLGPIDVTGDFDTTTTCGTVLAIDTSCAITVTLNATAPGQRLGMVTVVNDANPLTVQLAGSAVGSSNLALNKPAEVSGSQDGYPPSNMTDGNTGSYWESTNNAFPQWAAIDLGAPTSISRIVLTVPPPSAWSTRTQTISILGSADGVTYSPILPPAGYTFDPATGNTVKIKFTPANVRYVKLNVTANTGWPAAQFSEVEVFQ